MPVETNVSNFLVCTHLGPCKILPVKIVHVIFCPDAEICVIKETDVNNIVQVNLLFSLLA